MAANKVFNIASAKDVRFLLDYMNRYQRDMKINLRKALDRITYEVGIPAVDSRYGAGMGDSSSEHQCSFRASYTDDTVTGILTVQGKDVAFIEFGAGVYYNTYAGSSPHPKGEELGYTIGSYGQGQGRYDIWVYLDENGNRQVSYGTEATMPLYNALKEMTTQISRIFREVFANV